MMTMTMMVVVVVGVAPQDSATPRAPLGQPHDVVEEEEEEEEEGVVFQWVQGRPGAWEVNPGEWAVAWAPWVQPEGASPVPAM
jgi:hypothetical protein